MKLIKKTFIDFAIKEGRKTFSLFSLFFLLSTSLLSQPAPKPLYLDPVYDGAADPTIIYHKKKKTWWMFYTNRRANMTDTTGVAWVHGTRIGIATSKDGVNWTYKDTADIRYRPEEGYTFWAPEVIHEKGSYHMFLTYVPGIFTNWNHPRYIVHLKSKDALHWDFVSKLNLVNDKVIDACVFKLPEGGWRLWYNNERDGKSIYYADSKDLDNWEDKGKAIAARGEGPKVFRWQNQYWMLIDVWKGMEFYRSDDLLHWEKQPERILEQPGKGKDDGAIGGHADVIVSGDRAFVFYFTHPGRAAADPKPVQSKAWKRSVIQVTELTFKDGKISCNRDNPTFVRLLPNN
jgi:predicted GH43/DUF377 family glycosyl hydrolase